MDCYLTIDDLSPPATPPSSSTSTSSTTTTCSRRGRLLPAILGINEAQSSSPSSSTKLSTSSIAPYDLPLTTTMDKKTNSNSQLDMLGSLKTVFRHLNTNQKQQFLTELIGCCDNTLLAFINTLVAPKLKLDFLRLLPTEISLHILSYINDPYTLAQASQVSSVWHSVLMDETIWKELCYQHHYHPPLSLTEYNNNHGEKENMHDIDNGDNYNNNKDGDKENDNNQPGGTYDDTTAMDEGDDSETNNKLIQYQQPLQKHEPELLSLMNVSATRPSHRKNKSPLSSLFASSPSINSTTPAIPSSNLPTSIKASTISDFSTVIKSTLSSPTTNTPSIPSYKHFFRRQYQIDMAWSNGGNRITACPNDIGNALVTSLQMDDEFIVVGCDNNRIEVFDATTGNHSRTLRGHHGGVWALQFIKTDSHCILVSGGCDRDARVWNLRTGQLYHTLQGHSSTIRCLKIRDSKTAISGSRDSTLRIWDIEHGRLKHLCLGHHSSVRCLDIRGNRVVSGSYDYTARLWDIDTGECLFVCRGHQSQIYAVAFDDSRIVTGSLDSTIKVWSVADRGKCLATLHGHTTLVGHLQLLPDLLISGGSDGCVRYWNLTTYECEHRISAHDNSVTCLQVDGKHVLSGGSDGSVKLFDLNSGQLIRSFTQPGRTVWKLECHATKAVVVIQRRLHGDRDSAFHTAIELHDFDYQQ